MGRAQPHRIAGHHGGPPAKSGTASPHGPKKAWLGSFAPNCGERTILVGTSLRFGSSFRAFGRSVSNHGEPVAIAREGLGLFRDARWPLLRDAVVFSFRNSILASHNSSALLRNVLQHFACFLARF